MAWKKAAALDADRSAKRSSPPILHLRYFYYDLDETGHETVGRKSLDVFHGRHAYKASQQNSKSHVGPKAGLLTFTHIQIVLRGLHRGASGQLKPIDRKYHVLAMPIP